jgi:hypothetical protein
MVVRFMSVYFDPVCRKKEQPSQQNTEETEQTQYNCYQTLILCNSEIENFVQLDTVVVVVFVVVVVVIVDVAWKTLQFFFSIFDRKVLHSQKQTVIRWEN